MGLFFFISAQSSLPGPQDPLLNVIMKKLGHVIVYAILTVLLLCATANRQARWHPIALCLFVSKL
jgi:VanZ family protein